MKKVTGPDCVSVETLTWDYITGIHGIFVFNEAEAVHELDFSYFAGAMGGEVCFDVGFGSWRGQRRIG